MKKIEEAFARIERKKEDNHVDAARMLLSLQNDNDVESNVVRIDLPLIYLPTIYDSHHVPKFLDLPQPKDGKTYQPAEVWEVFSNVKDEIGATAHKHTKVATMEKAIELNLVPVKKGLCTI